MFSERIFGNSNKLLSILILIIVFLIPIWVRLALLFIPLLVIVWVMGRNWKNVIPEIRKNRFAQILILFWFLHLIGVLYPTNWKYGLQDVQQKLSFILFPIIIITLVNSNLFNINKAAKVFLIGSFISGIICLINAFWNSISVFSSPFIFNPFPHEVYWDNYFTYTRFAFLNHPSYLAMYFTFSVAILFKLIKENKQSVPRLISYIVVIIFFCILIYLLSSRVGILALILTTVAGLVWLFTNRIKWVLKLGIAGTVGVLIFVVFLSLNKGSTFVNNLKEDIFFNLNPKKSDFNNTYDMRFYLWQCIPDVMSKNFLFGYGTGDSHIALNAEYDKRNLVSASEKDYNAHNQFLESLVSLGFVGFLLMFTLIAYPVVYLLKREANFLSILFLLIILINFLAESMLSRIAGILFFGLFYCLFFCLKKDS